MRIINDIKIAVVPTESNDISKLHVSVDMNYGLVTRWFQERDYPGQYIGTF